MFTKKGARGFTLIELLVVIAIIGLLSSVVLASLNSARTKGRDARRLSDVKQVQLALELYYNDNAKYPVGTGSAVAIATALTSLKPNYIPSIPDDPNGGSQHYYYIADTNGTSYCIGVKMEATTVSTLPAASCSTPAYVTALNSADGGTTGTTAYNVGP
jgi:type II secretion system protein G